MWRELVNGLYCDGWNNVCDLVVEYFIFDFYDILFFMLGFECELKIGFVGGVFYCIFGNYRLSVGKVWLVYNIGEKVIFKKVNCIYCLIKSGIKVIL